MAPILGISGRRSVPRVGSVRVGRIESALGATGRGGSGGFLAARSPSRTRSSNQRAGRASTRARRRAGPTGRATPLDELAGNRAAARDECPRPSTLTLTLELAFVVARGTNAFFVELAEVL